MSNDDKLTKVLLAVIAVAFCMIALNPWLHPVQEDKVAEAQSDNSQYSRYQFHNKEWWLLYKKLGGVYPVSFRDGGLKHVEKGKQGKAYQYWQAPE